MENINFLYTTHPPLNGKFHYLFFLKTFLEGEITRAEIHFRAKRRRRDDESNVTVLLDFDGLTSETVLAWTLDAGYVKHGWRKYDISELFLKSTSDKWRLVL